MLNTASDKVGAASDQVDFDVKAWLLPGAKGVTGIARYEFATLTPYARRATCWTKEGNGGVLSVRGS